MNPSPSDEEITEAIREKGGAFSFGKWALATIAKLKDDNIKWFYQKEMQTTRADALQKQVTALQDRLGEQGKLTEERIARVAYDGGIYGVCSWKELAHDHTDRADFLARARAVIDYIAAPSKAGEPQEEIMRAWLAKESPEKAGEE